MFDMMGAVVLGNARTVPGLAAPKTSNLRNAKRESAAMS